MQISVEEWNAKYPAGTKVRIEKQVIELPAREHVTSCEAVVWDDGVARVRVDDGKCFIALQDIDSVVSGSA